ncbi:MAG: IS1634 family transposase [Candidatus Anammoxibacter sp.]
MHIVRNKITSKNSKKIYESVLLRESYREDGKVKKRTIANISHCSQAEIKAIELALKHKDDLGVLGSLKDDVELRQGVSIGAVWVLYHVAKELGIEKAIGSDFQGKLALWLVLARVIDQGSRLSAVRLAQNHAACDVLGILRGFDENDLYANLKWLSENQSVIEDNLFKQKYADKPPELFLYDVTSSYLEGKFNYFGAFGYNRDGKKGKMQIVIGMLCDETGDPVSTEVFIGNTKDTATFGSQVKKTSERFGCKHVTFVGDRGMIKRAQIELLPEGYHYITAITKPQINTLIKKDVIQMSLFDQDICDIEDNGVRYILRRNPVRLEEIAESRQSKLLNIEKLTETKNVYLKEHPRAKISVAQKTVAAKIKRLKMSSWLKVELAENGSLKLIADENQFEEASTLDGCYVIKTDLSKDVAGKHIIHDRYKDLALVEQAFGNSKTRFLEIRPLFVRTKESTQGHVLVVMLAYKILRRLNTAWKEFDLTAGEGVNQLSTICSMELKIKGGGSCLKIPKPRKELQELLRVLDISMPRVLPHKEVSVVTRKKLQKQRKP